MYSKIAPRFWLCSAALMVGAAFLFYAVQNSGSIPGGSVPFIKSTWLFSVLFYWYVMPAIWLTDAGLPSSVKIVFGVALANMVIRAIVELPMMYMTSAWQHAYGVGHDGFSVLLNLALLLWLSRRLNLKSAKWIKWYFLVSAVLFTIEAMFAMYLRIVTAADGRVFFLPAEQSHVAVLSITAVAVVFTLIAVTTIVSASYDDHA